MVENVIRCLHVALTAKPKIAEPGVIGMAKMEAWYGYTFKDRDRLNAIVGNEEELKKYDTMGKQMMAAGEYSYDMMCAEVHLCVNGGVFQSVIYAIIAAMKGDKSIIKAFSAKRKPIPKAKQLLKLKENMVKTEE